MKAFHILLLAVLIISTRAEEDDDSDGEGSGTITVGTLEPAIMDGPSLSGTSVSQLRENKKHKVAIAGSIENYSKWLLHLRGCEVANTGKLNVPPRSVHQGYREGFAGYKDVHTTKAFHMCCTFHASRYFIHVLYVAPCQYNHNHNTLAVAICPDKISYCKKFNSKLMYNQTIGLVKIQEFMEGHTDPLTRCYGDFCFTGTMGTSPQAVVKMKLFPKKYDDLSRHIVVESFKTHWSDKDYERFISELKG